MSALLTIATAKKLWSLARACRVRPRNIVHAMWIRTHFRISFGNVRRSLPERSPKHDHERDGECKLHVSQPI